MSKPDPALADIALRTIRWWITEIVRHEREAREISIEEVAARSGVIKYHQLYAFERHESWPRNFDGVIAGYAAAFHCEAWDLWQRAIDMWREYGSPLKPPESAWSSNGINGQLSLT